MEILLRKLPEKLKIFEFLKLKILKVPGGKPYGIGIPGKKFTQISEYLASFSSFPDIPEIVFHSSLEIFWNSNQNFQSNGWRS